MANCSVLSVTFEIKAQSHQDGHFSVPKKIVDALGMGRKRAVHLEIWSPHGRYSGVKSLASGNEIYGPELRNCVKAGETILVTVSPG